MTMDLEQSHIVEIMRYSGEMEPIRFPAIAEADHKFLVLWLQGGPMGKSDHTQRAYIQEVIKFYEVVKKPIADIRDLKDIYDFIATIAKLKPSSQKRAVAAIKSALTFAYKNNHNPVNVGQMVKLPDTPDTLAERILTEQQVTKILAAETDPRNHAILILLYRSGIRVSELCNLTWKNLSERNEAGQVSVFGKGQRSRHVLISQQTWDELIALFPADGVLEDYVFQSRQLGLKKSAKRELAAGQPSTRMEESTVRKLVRRVAKRAGVKGNVSPHWMRHSHATHALEHGAPITLVKDTLGHKSIETTAKYTHVRPNSSSSMFLEV